MALPTITIIGSGYVGVTSAAIFANAGYRVYALEINPERLSAIQKGQSFFYEEYINPLLHHAVESGSLIGTNSYKEAISQSDVVFSCVGTPDKPDGSSDLSYVMAAAKEAIEYAKPNSIYVQKSTVPVGTGAKIEDLLASQNKNIAYVSNPEFLREGSALIDSVWFDRVVVGGSNSEANKKVNDIYKHVALAREAIAMRAGIDADNIPKGLKNEYLTTTRSSAELIKVSANAFLALKISFANSIAKLADAAGADIVQVTEGIGSDPRIGRAFLNAGRGYGGGCFPKDVSGLISSGLEHGVELNIMQAASAENHSMPGYIIKKASRHIGDGTFANKRVAILGAAFKANTSDSRKSPAIKIANIMSEKMGAVVSIYDPKAFSEDGIYKELHSDILVCSTVVASLQDADMAIIATDWQEFRDMAPIDYAKHLKGTLIVDAMNCLDPDAVRQAGLKYIGVGR